MAKLTEKEKAKLLGKLQAYRRELEKTPLYRDFQEFLGLSEREKAKRNAAWDVYYRDVRNTTTYALYEEQKKALFVRDYPRVRELAQEARTMRQEGLVPELPLPPYTDPWEFSNSSIMTTLKDIEQRIKMLVSEGIDIEDLGF